MDLGCRCQREQWVHLLPSPEEQRINGEPAGGSGGVEGTHSARLSPRTHGQQGSKTRVALCGMGRKVTSSREMVLAN